MTYVTVVETEIYLRDAERLLTSEEREAVITKLAQDPEQGDLIKGTKGLRKSRFGFGGKGKRGGSRVIYWFKTERLPLVLLTVYAKNESTDLSEERKRYLMKLTSNLEGELGGRG